MNPLFSIITPVYNTPLNVLREMVESILAQEFPDWELILIDDFSSNPEVQTLLTEFTHCDKRIRAEFRTSNGHIVAASNDGIDLAKGEFIVLVDHDDLITDDALAEIANAIKKNPDADYIYSDEDKLGVDGDYYDEFRKPDWSPERLRGQMYTSHLSVLRTSLVREVGGFREGFDGGQDYDLVLRVTEKARQVVHVPRVLYHWRVVPGSAAGDLEAKPYAFIAGKKALQEHRQRIGLSGTVVDGSTPGTYQVQYLSLTPRLLFP